MNRRGFLGFLGAAIVGATLDKDRLLWEPGKKLISIPPARKLVDHTALLEIGDIIEFAGRYAINPVTRMIAVNPETGEPFLQKFVITAKGESRIDLFPYAERGKARIASAWHPANGHEVNISS